jgi:hypothetical protein
MKKADLSVISNITKFSFKVYLFYNKSGTKKEWEGLKFFILAITWWKELLDF